MDAPDPPPDLEECAEALAQQITDELMEEAERLGVPSSQLAGEVGEALLRSVF